MLKYMTRVSCWLRPLRCLPRPRWRRRSTQEPNVDRPGSDYRDFDLRAPDPQICGQACLGDKSCVAWTFVREGVQGPSPRCWLKNAVPAPQPSDCCTSGIIQ